MDEKDNEEPREESQEEMPDENMQLFIYGNLMIKDVESDEILVNKSF